MTYIYTYIDKFFVLNPVFVAQSHIGRFFVPASMNGSGYGTEINISGIPIRL